MIRQLLQCEMTCEKMSSSPVRLDGVDKINLDYILKFQKVNREMEHNFMVLSYLVIYVTGRTEHIS